VRKLKKFARRFIKLIIILVILVCIIGGTGAYYVLDKYYKELPDIAELIENYSPSLPTRIFDRNGDLIDILFVESRDVVRVKDVPDITKGAFLSIEDKQFYKHHGIHIKRNIGAILANLKAGRTVQGASSITQQLAKNAFLSQERTLSRKIKEAIITIEIERRYTKDEILEKYLNEVNFGNAIYGIKTAAKHYFKKDVDELNIAESALLACIPNRPSTYDPRRHLDAAIKRSHLILREMLRDNKITNEEYEKAINYQFINEDTLDEDFVATNGTSVIYNKEGGSSIVYPDFTNIVSEFLTDKFPEPLVFSGGLTVHTTMDIKMQNMAKDCFENYDLFKRRSYLNGGMVTIDPNNGHVISIVGGRDFKSGNFNRATMARRQVGSSFKPFLYFTALLNGYETTTVIEDSFFSQGRWVPKNFGGNYSDNVTLQNALDRSLNIVSIKLLRNVGIDTFKSVVEKVNPNIKIPENLTAALGSFEATPLQMAIGYSMFSNGGYVVSPIVVTSVEDRNGNIIYTEEIKKDKVFDSVDTSVITSMLSSSVARGSSARARVLTKDKKAIAQGGKTGTTNENRTVWFVGITPEYITAIYVGRDDNKKVDGITGGSGAAPLWSKYYQTLINTGLYIPGEFSYLDNHIKNGELYLQYVDPRTGFVAQGGREYVVRSSGLQLERESKYANGIAGILSIDIMDTIYGRPDSQDNSSKDDDVVQDILNR
jgi:penicillin-binding protein 1A